MSLWTLSASNGSVVLTNSDTSAHYVFLKSQVVFKPLTDVQFNFINLNLNFNLLLNRTDFVTPAANTTMELFLDSVATLLG